MDTVRSEIVHKPSALVGTSAALLVLYFVGQIIYRLYFHPLHHIPGPWLNAVFRIPYARHLIAGTTVDNVKQLHDKYGEVVRISPNEVSFTSGETAWQDIYGFRTGKLRGHRNMPKDPAWYAKPPTGTQIIVANDEDHARFRKTLSHAFSEKALAQQEVLLQGYTDLLINRLKEVTSIEQGTQDMAQWYNWTNFDIIADLLFGEPFGCLQDLSTHKYVAMLFEAVKAFRWSYIFYYWPFMKQIHGLAKGRGVQQARIDFYAWIGNKTRTRIEQETQRPDFMTEILKHNGEKGAELTAEEIANNAVVLIMAGSETTATTLSGVTYLLLKNPATMQKLKDEVRGKWAKYDDITLEAVNHTPYLIAVLQEALRYFPPVPTGFERRTVKGGEVVSGYYIPEDTAVCVSSWPTGHSKSNFNDADSFIPERWMGDPRFADDKKNAIQPFSFGPRSCLGKNLANAEMRLILAKIIWSFDLELDPKCLDWMSRCKALNLWDKPELAVNVKEAMRV